MKDGFDKAVPSPQCCGDGTVFYVKVFLPKTSRSLSLPPCCEKALPFEPLIPNEETIAAMEAARRGDLLTVGSVDALMADLNADD